MEAICVWRINTRPTTHSGLRIKEMSQSPHWLNGRPSTQLRDPTKTRELKQPSLETEEEYKTRLHARAKRDHKGIPRNRGSTLSISKISIFTPEIFHARSSPPGSNSDISQSVDEVWPLVSQLLNLSLRLAFDPVVSLAAPPLCILPSEE